MAEDHLAAVALHVLRLVLRGDRDKLPVTVFIAEYERARDHVIGDPISVIHTSVVRQAHDLALLIADHQRIIPQFGRNHLNAPANGLLQLLQRVPDLLHPGHLHGLNNDRSHFFLPIQQANPLAYALHHSSNTNSAV